ncbi:MAG: hypothetical protein PF448_13925 [Bacteroidales bacterium]|jgi:hypothetical protein|nr:hypothetical protein [Bacteroidales bacterium]
MKKLLFPICFVFAICFFYSCEKEVEPFDTNIRFVNLTNLDFDSVIMEYSMFESLFLSDFFENDTSNYYYTGFLEESFHIYAYSDSSIYFKYYKIPTFAIDATNPYYDCAPGGYYTYSFISVDELTGEINLGLTEFKLWLDD